MDHSEANRLMASEKYLLDELSPDQIEAFEEHLFNCHECATDVRAGSLFLEQGKVELASPAAPERVPAEVPEPSGWFAWLRPAFAVPALAVLLLVVGYQNLVTYPALKNALAENKAPRILPAASLVSSVRRGPDGPSIISVRAGEPFLLPLEVPAQNAFPSYMIELHNPAGGVQWSLPVSAEAIRNTLPIAAPGVDRAGRYELVVIGLNAQGVKVSEVGRYPFELQFARAANPEP